MKTKSLLTVLLAVGMLLSLSGPVEAYTHTFGDSQNHWPGWGNGTGDDGRDTIGIPDMLGGVAEFGVGLEKLTFNYTAGSLRLWHLLEPSDLFIDVGEDDLPF